VLINDSFCSGTLDSTSLSIAVEPKNGTVSIENTPTSTKIRYTPIPNFAGIDQLVYKVCDKQGNCSLGTVQIAGQRSNSNCESVFQNDDFYYNIKPANDTIYTKGVKISVLENDRICYVNGYDYENKILVAPANGTAVFVGSLLIYTPKIGFKGTDAIDYTVCEVSPNLTNCLGKAKIFIKID
ncbi:MAG: Ig-like domain-containing protein, partial [Verrucomicrobia bacterium]|nr:Ig-like domain-containing protein [Cytophagales bacterium]